MTTINALNDMTGGLRNYTTPRDSYKASLTIIA
jgi:hypothetical protein